MKLRLLLILIFSLVSFMLKAQYLENPSFESDSSAMAQTPDGWMHCNSNSTPDIQPGYLNVDMQSSNGSTYLGLILLDPTDGDGPKNEGVCSRLIKPLYKDSLYSFSIDLADAPYAYELSNSPQKLKISGGYFACSKADTLAMTDTIRNTDWQTYKYILVPSLDSINYLKLEIYGDIKRTRGYMLLDNIILDKYRFKDIPPLCQGQQNIKYELPILQWPRELICNYTGRGITVTDKTTFMQINIDEDATSGDLSIQFKTSNRIIGPYIIPLKIDSLPSEADNITGEDIVCALHSADFSIPGVKNAENYNWDFSGSGASLTGNSDSITIVFSEGETSGELTVTPVNHCGNGKSSPPFSIEIASCNINIPNSFSPNNDGINDTWVIENLNDNSKLIIIDRYGRLVYSTNNYQNNWDGTDLNGKKLPTDAYWFILTSDFVPKRLKGFIYLKR
jgi:gliding motility-associated-like protein